MHWLICHLEVILQDKHFNFSFFLFLSNFLKRNYFNEFSNHISWGKKITHLSSVILLLGDQRLILTVTAPGKIEADILLFFVFFYFYYYYFFFILVLRKIRFNTSYESTARQNSHMKCQALFPLKTKKKKKKKKKNISNIVCYSCDQHFNLYHSQG